jgi:hypothetical protein
MQVIVLFNSLEKLKNVLRTFDAQKENITQFHLFSLGPLSEEDLELALDLEYPLSSCLNTKDALQQVAEVLKLNSETILTLDNVVPVSDWHAHILNYKRQYPNMNVAFGRWYRDAIAGREFISNDRLGFKFKDAIPSLIGNYVYDHFPDPTSHCLQVLRFPIFFNWFSEEMTAVLKSCLSNANSISELSHFISDYGAMSKEKGRFYYLPNIEVLDQRLLK